MWFCLVAFDSAQADLGGELMGKIKEAMLGVIKKIIGTQNKGVMLSAVEAPADSRQD